MGSFFDSVRQTKGSWNPPDGAGSRLEDLQQGPFRLRTNDAKVTPPNMCKWLEFSTSGLKEETQAVNIWLQVHILSYLRLYCSMFSIHVPCMLLDEHGGLFHEHPLCRNFPHFSFQTASPSLPPIPQITRNWMIFGLGSRIIATYALHFVNEEIWILLEVGASTRELTSSFMTFNTWLPSTTLCSSHLHFKLLEI